MNKKELEKLTTFLNRKYFDRLNALLKLTPKKGVVQNDAEKEKLHEAYLSLMQIVVVKKAIQNHISPNDQKKKFFEFSALLSDTHQQLKKDSKLFDRMQRNIYYRDLPTFLHEVFPEKNMNKSRDVLLKLILRPAFENQMGVKFTKDVLKKLKSFSTENLQEDQCKNARGLNQINRFFYLNNHLKKLNMGEVFGIKAIDETDVIHNMNCNREGLVVTLFNSSSTYLPQMTRGKGAKYLFYSNKNQDLTYLVQGIEVDNIEMIRKMQISLQDFIPIKGVGGYIEIKQLMKLDEFRKKFSTKDTQFILHDVKDSIDFFAKEIFANIYYEDHLQYIYPANYQHKHYLGNVHITDQATLIYKQNGISEKAKSDEPIAYLRVITKNNNGVRYKGDIAIYR